MRMPQIVLCTVRGPLLNLDRCIIEKKKHATWSANQIPTQPVKNLPTKMQQNDEFFLQNTVIFFKVNYFTRRMEFRTAIVVTLYNTWDSPKTLISSRKQNLYQFYWFLGFLREILIIFQTAISRLLVVAQYIK
jgi:hypothetical protein